MYYGRAHLGGKTDDSTFPVVTCFIVFVLYLYISAASFSFSMFQAGDNLGCHELYKLAGVSVVRHNLLEFALISVHTSIFNVLRAQLPFVCLWMKYT